MISTTLSDFRNNLKKYLDNVSKDVGTLVVEIGKNSSVVVISLAEYNSFKSVEFELSSRTNEARLDASSAKLRTGGFFEKDLIDL